jgi:hypothetical protein
VGRLSWIAGRQAVPVQMPKPLSSPDDMAEDDGSPTRRYGSGLNRVGVSPVETSRPKMGFATVWVGKDDVPPERRYRSRINWVGVCCGRDVPAGRLGEGVGSHLLKAGEI